jgi:hypothetical protein
MKRTSTASERASVRSWVEFLAQKFLRNIIKIKILSEKFISNLDFLLYFPN